MNGFKKEYWQRKKEINKQLRKYYVLSFGVSAILNISFFYTDPYKILFAKMVILAVLIMGILEAKFNLPNFFIEEDKDNKEEVRVLMIVVPFVIYLLLLFGWFSS